MRRIALLSLILLAACDTGGVVPSTGPDGSMAPTTTEPPGDCLRLAIDAADHLEGLIAALNDVTTEQFEDPAQWPENLVDLQAKGRELDQREAELKCDRSIIQQVVVQRASEIEATGPVARFLLGLLLAGG